MDHDHDRPSTCERIEPLLFFFGTLGALGVLIALVCRVALQG